MPWPSIIVNYEGAETIEAEAHVTCSRKVLLSSDPPASSSPQGQLGHDPLAGVRKKTWAQFGLPLAAVTSLSTSLALSSSTTLVFPLWEGAVEGFPATMLERLSRPRQWRMAARKTPSVCTLSTAHSDVASGSTFSSLPPQLSSRPYPVSLSSSPLYPITWRPSFEILLEAVRQSSPIRPRLPSQTAHHAREINVQPYPSDTTLYHTWR